MSKTIQLSKETLARLHGRDRLRLPRRIDDQGRRAAPDLKSAKYWRSKGLVYAEHIDAIIGYYDEQKRRVSTGIVRYPRTNLEICEGCQRRSFYPVIRQRRERDDINYKHKWDDDLLVRGKFCGRCFWQRARIVISTQKWWDAENARLAPVEQELERLEHIAKLFRRLLNTRKDRRTERAAEIRAEFDRLP